MVSLRSLLVCGLTLVTTKAQAINLSTAAAFAVLGASTVTNTGLTVLTGDLGVFPGTAITGFPPGIDLGTIHNADAVAQIAQNDATTAYNVAAGLAFSPGNDLTGKNLGGLILTPSVYHFDSSAFLTGILTLDGNGDPNSAWVFQIGSTLISSTVAVVALINGAQPCNVLWQVGSSATLGVGTVFAGNIVALASITTNTGVINAGGLYALTAAVTLDDDLIVAQTKCAPITSTTTSTTSSSSSTSTPSTMTTTSSSSLATSPTSSTTFISTTSSSVTASSASLTSSTLSSSSFTTSTTSTGTTSSSLTSSSTTSSSLTSSSTTSPYSSSSSSLTSSSTTSPYSSSTSSLTSSSTASPYSSFSSTSNSSSPLTSSSTASSLSNLWNLSTSPSSTTFFPTTSSYWDSSSEKTISATSSYNNSPVATSYSTYPTKVYTTLTTVTNCPVTSTLSSASRTWYVISSTTSTVTVTSCVAGCPTLFPSSQTTEVSTKGEASYSTLSIDIASSAGYITEWITSAYVDICPTGLTTKTTIYSTLSNPVSAPTYNPGPPPGWTTTVAVCTQCAPVPTTVTLTIPLRIGDSNQETDPISTPLGLFQASSVAWKSGKPIDPSVTSELPARASSSGSTYNGQPIGTQSESFSSTYISKLVPAQSGIQQDPVEPSSLASTYSSKNTASTQSNTPPSPPPRLSASSSGYSINVYPMATQSSTGPVDPPSQIPASSSSSSSLPGSPAATPALFTGAAMIVYPARFLTGFGLLMVIVFF